MGRPKDKAILNARGKDILDAADQEILGMPFEKWKSKDRKKLWALTVASAIYVALLLTFFLSV